MTESRELTDACQCAKGFSFPCCIVARNKVQHFWREREKAAIARRGNELGIDYRKTWSCYKGGTIHCGTCGTCVERREAFLLAGVTDPTEYLETPPLPEAPGGGAFPAPSPT